MPRITGLDQIKLALSRRADRARREYAARLSVGYSAPYAIFVHENLQAVHPRGGQAKFLETPARTTRPIMKRIIEDRVKQGYLIEQALKAAGAVLLKASQELCPVNTGALRDSGYVKVEVGDEKGGSNI